MQKNHVRFRFFGDLTQLDPKLQKLCLDAQSQSAVFDHEVQVNFCLTHKSLLLPVWNNSQLCSEKAEDNDKGKGDLYEYKVGKKEPKQIDVDVTAIVQCIQFDLDLFL